MTGEEFDAKLTRIVEREFDGEHEEALADAVALIEEVGRGGDPEKLLALGIVLLSELDEPEWAGAIAGPLPDRVPPELRARARAFVGHYHLVRGEWEEAARGFQEARAADPPPGPADHAWIAYGEGLLAHERWDFKGAREALERAAQIEPDRPDYAFELGVACDRLGDTSGASRAFQQAATLDPDGFPPPPRIGRKTFDRMAREALADLPGEFTSQLDPIEIIAEPYPRPEAFRSDPDFSPRSLGVFWGTSVADQASPPAGYIPNQIVLFQRNIENSCASEEEVEEEIWTTVFHEVGHFLGFDEDELEDLGLG